MPDQAQVNRSLSTIRSELEFLRDSGVIHYDQFQNIVSQLPGPDGQNGQQNNNYNDYTHKYAYQPQYGQQPQQQYTPPPPQQQQQYQPPPPPSYAPVFQQVAQDAQNPQNPANPQNPKHHQWAQNLGSKFGNAVVFGAGATLGGDLVNDVLKRF